MKNIKIFHTAGYILFLEINSISHVEKIIYKNKISLKHVDEHFAISSPLLQHAHIFLLSFLVSACIIYSACKIKI
jgi:hypothetical protein